MGREMTQAGGEADLGGEGDTGQWWDVLVEGEQRGHLSPQGALSLRKAGLERDNNPGDL